MIEAIDTLRFHQPRSEADRNALWAETNAFDLYIAEEGISISVYTIFRPFIQNALSNISVWKGFSSHPVDVLYNDFQVHVRIPQGQQLGDCSLPNGLHIRSVNAPMNYEVTYKGLDGTEMEFKFEGLMPPQDITDPKMDPITAQKVGAPAQEKGVDADAAFTGHYEQTGHFTGSLKLQNKTYEIDCVSTIDHSWGPRPESDCPVFAWGHAHFGRSLAIHWIFAADPLGSVKYGPLAHGYVMDNGKVYGLVEGSGRVERRRLAQSALRLQVKDVRGKTFELEGRPMNAATWNPWPMVWGLYSLHEWTLDRQKGKGYGCNIEFASVRHWSRNKPL